MPNIFDGLKKMEVDRYRYLVATLETVNITNITSEMGQNAKKGSIKVANSIMKIMKKEQMKVPEVVSLEERIKTRKSELDDLNRHSLDRRIKNVLLEKLKMVGEEVDQNASDDEISVAVISEASKSFKKEIDGILSPAQKADEIRYRYNSRLTAQVEKNLVAQNEKERIATENAIDDKLRYMPEDQKKELQKALNIQELSGKAVRKMMMTATGTTAALAALQVSGFGAYVALTTIMHAIFTTTLGITLPFAAYTGATSMLAVLTGPIGWIALIGTEIFMVSKSSNKLIYELLAQVVWGSVDSYGKTFETTREHLPSWLKGEAELKAVQESEEIRLLVMENENLRNDISRIEENLSKERELFNQGEKIKSQSQDLILATRKELDQQRNDKARLNEELITLQSNYREKERILNDIDEKEKETYEKELESLNKEYEDRNYQINNLTSIIYQIESKLIGYENDIEEKDREIEKLKVTIKKSESDVEEHRTRLNRKLTKESMIIDKSANELSSRWKIAYHKMDFEKSVFKYVSKHFSYTDLGYIEARLVEMHGSNDPVSLRSNRGKMNDGRHHIEINLPDIPGRIFYTVKKTSEEKFINILYIVKHNDPRYGKRY